MTLPSQPPSSPHDGPPALDPELAPALATMAAMPPMTAETLPMVRAARQRMVPDDDALSRAGAFSVKEIEVPGPAGAPPLSLVVCRPATAEGATPVVYYIHGGGFILGDNRSELPGLLDLALELELTVVSVAYRLAPETPFPAPVDDCYAALVWTAAHAADLDIDEQALVVAGGSAGGGLAAAVALMARDRGGPTLAGQLLMSPALDHPGGTASGSQMAGMWEAAVVDFGWPAYLGSDHGAHPVSPYAAPARAADLSGLPPSYVDVGSVEVLRDVSVLYADRIWKAGGSAELHVWPGAFHGFDLFAPQAQISQDARQARLRWLHRVLTR